MLSMLPRNGLKLSRGFRSTLQTKLMLLIALAAAIPLLTLGYVLYHKSSGTINEQFGRYGENSASQLQFQIDSTLGQMKYTVSDILSYLLDPKFTVLHEEVPTTYKGFQEEQQLEQYFKAHKSLDMKGIFLITKSGYYYGERIIRFDLLQAEPWFRDDADGYRFDLYEPKHYNDTARVPGEKVIGLLFRIRNQVGVLENSSILIETNADKLLRMFREFEQDTGSQLTITGGGKTVYQTQGSFAKRNDDVVWTKHSDETDWTIEVRTPYEQFYKPSLLIRTFTFSAVSLSIVLAFVLAYMCSAPLLKRVKKMKESIRRVSLGKLDTRIDVESEDELGLLGHSFNRMVGQLQTLFHEMKQVERQKKEAELRALHHQINPHLLINTLASIQWKARLAGAADLNKMIYHLTNVLDGNLNVDREVVTLERELEVIDHYLNLQELRYGSVFAYRIEAAGVDLSAVDIPRMTLQPLVENVFFHAFEDGEGTIVLRIEADGSDMLVSLIDDGKGMSEHTRQQLLQPHPDGVRKRRSIGLRNVEERIKLHFGEAYGLSVQSAPGAGTRIVIRLPIKTKEGIA